MITYPHDYKFSMDTEWCKHSERDRDTASIKQKAEGSFLEGGVRVTAQAWWPGMIEPQIAGDILHITDLFTTFARLGGGTKYIPTDRIIDGIDQTALLLNGDTRSRRDSVFIYAGPQLGATVKGNYKRHWNHLTPSAMPAASAQPSSSYRLTPVKSHR